MFQSAQGLKAIPYPDLVRIGMDVFAHARWRGSFSAVLGQFQHIGMNRAQGRVDGFQTHSGLPLLGAGARAREWCRYVSQPPMLFVVYRR